MDTSLPFRANAHPTVGVELELMLISEGTADLTSKAAQIVEDLQGTAFRDRVTLEVTQSMIELNSSAHLRHDTLHAELAEIGRALVEAAARHDTRVCGGGTHPYHRWQERCLSPGERFQEVAYLYGYLAKQFTVFGQHIHIGCRDGDDAIDTIQRLSRFVPHFITLAAASPFYRGVDTGFDSCRSNAVAAFPLSGRIHDLNSWKDFVDFFARLQRLGIASNLKDLYWDIRPKPELGTVELRIPDTPLDVLTAADLAAYAQALVEWNRQEEPQPWLDDYVYRYNRFQAARFGFAGHLIVNDNGEPLPIADDLLHTLDQCSAAARELGSHDALDRLRLAVRARRNGATWLREQFDRRASLPELMRLSCARWAQSLSAPTCRVPCVHGPGELP